jgi:hypothetical protein
MPIEVSYSDSRLETYASLAEAKEGILEALANGVLPDLVEEVDEKGETVMEYGCVWDVTLEENG